MNHKLPVFLKCAKLSEIFIAEREMRIKVSKRGMVKKEIIKKLRAIRIPQNKAH